VGTVKLHVSQIIAKLGVSDRTQAAVRAVELGLVTPPPV
jgi:DNA-binding NarL/FixJ family response regulator